MNDKNCIFLIDNKDKTDHIVFYEKIGDRYKIRYRSNDKIYSFGMERIKILPLKGRMNVENCQIYANEKLIKNVQEIFDYGERKTLILPEGKQYTYKAENIRIEHNCLQHQNPSKTLSYLTEVAGAVSLKSDDGTAILSKQYESLSFVGENSVLGYYVSPIREVPQVPAPSQIIFPFGLNPSPKKLLTRL